MPGSRYFAVLLKRTHSPDTLFMRHRAHSFLLSLTLLLLAAGCLTAAYALHFSAGPAALLDRWPEYLRTQAAQDPEREAHWLRRLIALTPRDTEARIRLAAIAEWGGDLAGAQAGLAVATTHDRRYRAQWSRLQFEARHPKLAPPGPWATARRCFAMSYGDRRPLLETVWALRPESRFLLEQVIPDAPPVLFYATAFFMEQDDLAGARQAFTRLLTLPVGSENRANGGLVATATERAHLGLDLVDLHLDRRQPKTAVALWQALRGSRLLEVDGADSAGRQIMNPRFRTAPLGRGFDWRPARTISAEMRQTEEGWRVDLAPHPPDRLVLLKQRVLLPAGPLPRVALKTNAQEWLQVRLLEEATNAELNGPLARPRVAALAIEYHRPAGRPPLREPLVIHYVGWSGAE